MYIIRIYVLIVVLFQVEDVSVFGPFKNSYAKFIHALVSKRLIGSTLTAVPLSDFTCRCGLRRWVERNIKDGYQKTGVVPFNRAVYHHQRENEAASVKAVKELSADQAERLDAAIAAQAAAYTRVLVEKTVSPLAERTRKRPRQEQDDAGTEHASSDEGDVAPEDVPLESLFAYEGGLTGDPAMTVVRAKAAKRQAQDQRSAAAASKRDAKNLLEAAAASKLLEKTPIRLAVWTDKDIRVVLAQRFKTKAAAKTDRATLLDQLSVLLTGAGFPQA